MTVHGLDKVSNVQQNVILVALLESYETPTRVLVGDLLEGRLESSASATKVLLGILLGVVLESYESPTRSLTRVLLESYERQLTGDIACCCLFLWLSVFCCWCFVC